MISNTMKKLCCIYRFCCSFDNHDSFTLPNDSFNILPLRRQVGYTKRHYWAEETCSWRPTQINDTREIIHSNDETDTSIDTSVQLPTDAKIPDLIFLNVRNENRFDSAICDDVIDDSYFVQTDNGLTIVP